MTLIRCRSCRVFFPKHERECPECGTPRRAVNGALESQKWRSNLNWQADHAVKYG